MTSELLHIALRINEGFCCHWPFQRKWFSPKSIPIRKPPWTRLTEIRVLSWLSRAPYWHGLTVVSAWIHIHVPSKYWMKSLIISQTSTVELLKFGKQFHPTLFNRCNCFSVLGSKLFLIKERDPWSTLVTGHLVLFCQVCATHLKIGNPCIKSRVMVSRSPNWLRRLDLTIGHQENSNKNGCQGDMHFWRIQLSVGTVCPT